jgi:hypothetical protein
MTAKPLEQVGAFVGNTAEQTNVGAVVAALAVPAIAIAGKAAATITAPTATVFTNGRDMRRKVFIKNPSFVAAFIFTSLHSQGPTPIDLINLR